MTWTRAQWITELLEVADAKDDPRWPSATTLWVLSSVYDKEWRALLDQKTTLRMQTLSLTRDAAGRVPWSDLTTGSGVTEKRVHRVMAVYDASNWYEHEDWRLSPTASDLTNGAGSARCVYRREGDYLQMAPVASDPITVVVSHLPCMISMLPSDATAVEWPEGFENVVLFEAASRMLRKGGADTDPSNELAALAAQFRNDMVSALGRESIEPKRMLLGDDPASWGGL